MLNQIYRQNKSDNTRHYVDSRRFANEVDKSIAAGRQATEELGRMFMEITNHLALSYSFNRYSEEWKTEMKGNALVKCVKAVNTVDPSKARDVFNYFSRIAYNAFIETIKKMKRRDRMLKLAKTVEALNILNVYWIK